MYRKNLILLLGLLCSFALPAWDSDVYPTNNRLFHIERSKNKNLICYDVNLNNAGKLDMSNPVKVYWINREDRPGKQNELSPVQQRLAFGYKIVSHDAISATIAVNACSNRPMRIVKNNNNYACLVQINKQEAQLETIYVRTKTPNSITVEYVELHGRNKKGEAVTERINN